MSEVTKLPEARAEALPADPMISMIERIVMDPTADLDKLERMLAMKERMEAKSAREAFSNAMAACQSEMQPVARNKSNDQTRSRYADLAAIYAACKPICAKYGFSFSTFPASSEKPGHMGVRWTLRHSGGHEESALAEVPIDDKGMKGTANKTQTHAFGSTASYARRYLFCMIFDIATNDDNDGNNRRDEAPEKPTDAEISAIKSRLKGHPEGVSAWFMDRFNITDFDQVSVTQLREANVMLTKREAAEKGAGK